MEIKAVYKGNGEFYHGIPMRDLTTEEYAALPDEGRALVDSRKIYDVTLGKASEGE